MVDPNHGVPNFTQQQKKDLERLWKAQTNDAQDGGNVPDRIKPIDSTSNTYMKRLYDFLFFFLKKHTRVESHGQDINNEEERRSRFLKDNLRESCLESFLSRFIERKEGRGSIDVKTIRLNEEKSVIMLHYEEFLSELNQYDFMGGEVCGKTCFGAFLYHHPINAIHVVNVAMGLAVISLWRLWNSAFSECEATTRNTNDSLKVNRFLDSCRIYVRFVHVKPQLPMAEIKTGILKKLIAVKGHVVKARPRRLRVLTADL